MSKQSQKPSPATLKTTDFTGNPQVMACLAELEKMVATNPLVVSDLIDDNYQYVELVQKGGGVLGIALVGYTYVLEMMGIRFLRLAGTSAGAINTALMTVIGGKTDAKSLQILEAICGLDFFKLVDGHPVARWLIKCFITHAGFINEVKKWALIIGGLLGLLVVSDSVLLGLQRSCHALVPWTMGCFIATGTLLLLIALAGIYTKGLLKRLKDAGFGINPGDYFYDWIKDQMADNKVVTVDDLLSKATAEIPGIRLRPGTNHPEGVDDLKRGDVTFITSELVTQNKIQLPAMCNLFRPASRRNELQPAGFVRASMAIPLFFESYFIKDIPVGNQEVQDAWLDTFKVANPPGSVRFVDGGVLSDFPINVFYNPQILVPRLPVFGIDLDDSKPGDQKPDPDGWSLLGYLGRIFNTLRFYYDKDFLLKNAVFEKGIGKIPLSEYNWLNFFLKPEDKIGMFVKGAIAAKEFLENFNWQDYKGSRESMQKEINLRNGVPPPQINI